MTTDYNNKIMNRTIFTLVVFIVCMSQHSVPAPFTGIEAIVSATVYELALLAAKFVISFVSPTSILHMILELVLGRVGVSILSRIVSFIAAYCL